MVQVGDHCAVVSRRENPSIGQGERCLYEVPNPMSERKGWSVEANPSRILLGT